MVSSAAGAGCGAGGDISSRISPQMLQMRSPGELGCPLRQVGLAGAGVPETGAGDGPCGVTSTDDRSQPQLWPSTVPSQKNSVTGRSVLQLGQSLIISDAPVPRGLAGP